MNDLSPFSNYRATPVYPDVALWQVQGAAVRPWEFNGWKPESLSWKQTAYIHAGLSAGGTFRYTGPGALDFLKSIIVNGFERFEIGAAKHAIMCDEAGLVTGHGVLQRAGEQDFTLFVSGLWATYQHKLTRFDVTEEFLDDFLFQVAGPASLQVIEAATGEDFHDLGFLRFRASTVDGVDVEVMRIGMAGGLAYEFHGPMEHAARVYDAVVRAGEPYGIERLGWRTYTVNHVEGGFPQTIWTFVSAAELDPGFEAFKAGIGMGEVGRTRYSGSVDPADRRARMRTPYEIGWGGMVKFDHDFIGRAALERFAANRTRTIATLEWNSEDVIDIHASLYRGGDEFKTIELPTSPHLRGFHGHVDRVTDLDGRDIGWSSGTTYSYYYRRQISHVTIDVADAELGREVILHWGDFGGTIKQVRATVARYPYLEATRNQDVDLASVPSGTTGAR